MAIPAKQDIPAMKDRSNVAALVLVLEAMSTVLMRTHLMSLDAAAKSKLREDLAQSLEAICQEVTAQAPVTGRGASLAPVAARRAADRIGEDARALLNEFLNDVAPAATK